MSNEPLPVEEIAKRFAELVNQFNPRTPLKAEDVTISHLANICFVLGITPSIEIRKVEDD